MRFDSEPPGTYLKIKKNDETLIVADWQLEVPEELRILKKDAKVKLIKHHEHQGNTFVSSEVYEITVYLKMSADPAVENLEQTYNVIARSPRSPRCGRNDTSRTRSPPSACASPERSHAAYPDAHAAKTRDSIAACDAVRLGVSTPILGEQPCRTKQACSPAECRRPRWWRMELVVLALVVGGLLGGCGEPADHELVAAVSSGDVSQVKKLLSRGANPNALDDSGTPVLFLASGKGGMPMIKELVAAGADVNATNKFGFTALMWAALSNNAEFVRMLLSAGADPDKVSHLETALRWARMDGEFEVGQVLLAGGADPDGRYGSDRTKLMDAAEEGYLRAVNILLSAEADPNAKDFSGTTALDEAAEKGHLKVVHALLDGGADPNNKGPQRPRRTKLMVTTPEGRLTTLGHTYPPDALAKMDKSTTPLMLAAENGHLEVVKTLIDAGADVNARDKNGSTALERSVKNDHVEVVRLLREVGAN